MTVWYVEHGKFGNTTKVRLSESHKNKKTDVYEQDFSGFCTFIGQAHEMASKLKEKDRIKILECDVGTTYDKEKRVEYVNYKVFNFELLGNNSANSQVSSSFGQSKNSESLTDGEVDEDSLPF